MTNSNSTTNRYVSCVLGCPYEGAIEPEAVAAVSQRLLEMGCYEISVGDTIGIGDAGSTARMLDAVQLVVPTEQLAVHFHDTYGQASEAAKKRAAAVVARPRRGGGALSASSRCNPSH